MKVSIRSIVTGLVLASAWLSAGCGGGSSKPPPGMGCALNSDCAAGLVCTFGLCHSACVVNGDCPSSPTQELCIKSSTPGDGATINVCQLPFESKCVYNSDCKSPLVCARDEQCRNQCQTSVDCISPQVCTPSGVCALQSQLAPGGDDVPLVTTGRPDAGAAGASGQGGSGASGQGGSGTSGQGGSGTSGQGGSAGTHGAGGQGGAAGAPGSGGTGVASCSGPQINFANPAIGDANPYFTSAAAVRNAETLFIFTGYEGPATVDAGADGGAPPGNAIFVQTFDVATGAKRGPSKLLFATAPGVYSGVVDAVIAPTGQIALLHIASTKSGQYQDQLFLTMVVPALGDAGAPTFSVGTTAQIESISCGSPHLTWHAQSGRFVASWKYLGSNGWYARFREYNTNGNASGTSVSAVPTYNGIYAPNGEDDAQAAVSGAYFGMAYQSNANNWPYLTILDGSGFQVGPLIDLLPAGVDNWVAAGGTTQGFVTMFTGGGKVSGAFVPITGVTSVISDAGAPDAGPAPFKTFSFTSTATTGHLISDDAGGAGGVGAVLLETGGASFVYVSSDGARQYAEGTVVSSSGGTQAGISNFGGSFVVSLFNGTTHAAAAAVSTCQ